MLVSPKLLTTLLLGVDYQAASLGNKQIDKKSEYTFAKLSSIKIYKN